MSFHDEDKDIASKKHEAALVVDANGDAVLTTLGNVPGQKTIGQRNAVHDAFFSDKEREQFWHLTKSGRVRFGGAEVVGRKCPKGGLVEYYRSRYDEEKCQGCEHNKNEQDVLSQAVGRFCKLAGRNETAENYVQEYSRRNFDFAKGEYDGTVHVERRIGRKYYDDEEQWMKDRDWLAEILKTVDSTFPEATELVPEKIEYSEMRIVKL